jgi:Etoposide-induced protein 2.4 (EI24)
MNRLLDAFWRAAAYCLHPRVIVLSLAPLLLAGGMTLALGYFFWEPAVAGMRATLEGWALIDALLTWLEGLGGSGLRALIAPLVIVALALPAIVVLSLLLVALFMAPALVSLVAKRRFADLEARRGAAPWQSVLWSLGCTLLALLALVLSIPLWFVPPLVLIVPPLIWGWLTYRVMAFDVLAEHASADERRTILREHRWPLLAIGVITGYLGAAPTLLWALGAAALIFAPLLVLVSVWLYTLVFAFAALWFAHYALAALQQLRSTNRPLAIQPIEALPQP